MSELRRAIRIIRDTLTTKRPTVTAALQSASGVYAEACQETNGRLLECQRLLFLDQRSEALRQVQLDPDALNLFQELAFDGHGKWREVAESRELESAGVVPPPRLRDDAAADLDRAYAAESAVRELLIQHRVLALRRAPLKQRLDVLRLLRQAEPLNASWEQDVRAFEAARLDEMRAARPSQSAGVRRDWLEAAEAELRTGAWLVPPPLDLVAAVGKALTDARRQGAVEQFVQLNRHMTAAQEVGNDEEVKRLVAKARDAAQQYGLAETDSLLAPCRTAENWLSTTRNRRRTARQFEHAVGRLREGLRDGIDWWYVQEYYREAQSFRRKLPADVAEAFAARARRRQVTLRAVLLGVGVGVAVMIGVLVAWPFR